VTRAAAALNLDLDEFLHDARQRLAKADAKKESALTLRLRDMFDKLPYEAARLDRLDAGVVEAVGFDPELGVAVHSFARLDDLVADDTLEAAVA
jgi:hypothetical protein